MSSTHAIPALDLVAGERARAAIDRKTKPPGSLGLLETLAVELARMQGAECPEVDPTRLYLSAGDHGIVAEGVSAWPQEVTAQMLGNFLAGGAAANVFARVAGCDVRIIDAGVATAVPDHPSLVRARIRQGTRNAALEDALTGSEVDRAIAFGMAEAHAAAEEGIRSIALGEMGIGNTSSATLVAHAITGIPVRGLTGPGAGLPGPEGLLKKREILERAARRRPGPLGARAALAAFGGLEIAVMAGLTLGAAARRRIVLVDGFIATSAVLAAVTECQHVRNYCVFCHRSAEPGHSALLEWMQAEPLLDLRLRLGEGTGALLALPVLRAACAMRSDMAEFETAGVSGKTPAQ